MDFPLGTASPNLRYLTAGNQQLIFAADDGNAGCEVWISDGTIGLGYERSHAHPWSAGGTAFSAKAQEQPGSGSTSAVD